MAPQDAEDPCILHPPSELEPQLCERMRTYIEEVVSTELQQLLVYPTPITSQRTAPAWVGCQRFDKEKVWGFLGGRPIREGTPPTPSSLSRANQQAPLPVPSLNGNDCHHHFGRSWSGNTTSEGLVLSCESRLVFP